MQIFRQIKESVYGPEFYQGLREQTLGFSFKYFFKFISLCAIVGAIVLSIVFVPKLRGMGAKAGSAVVAHYPAELAVTFAGGKVSTNVTEPYFVPMPKEFADADKTRGVETRHANLLVIDTKTAFSIEQYKTYDTATWLTRDFLIATDNKSIRVIPLESIPDVTINQAKVSEWAKRVAPFVSALSYFLPLIIFAGLFIALAFKLLYLLFGALVIWIAGKAFKWNLTYSKSYQMGMHAITTPILLFGILGLAGLWHPIFLLPTLILVITIAVNLRNQRNITT